MQAKNYHRTSYKSTEYIRFVHEQDNCRTMAIVLHVLQVDRDSFQKNRAPEMQYNSTHKLKYKHNSLNHHNT